MTALGVGVTSNDPTYGWATLQPKKLTRLERDYRKALAVCEEAFDRWVDVLDMIEDVKMYHPENLNRLAELEFAKAKIVCWMDEAEAKKHDAYLRLNCPHTHLKVIEGWGTSLKICELCGADEDDIHDSIIADNTAEITK